MNLSALLCGARRLLLGRVSAVAARGRRALLCVLARRLVETGCDDGNRALILRVLIIHRAEDDVGVIARHLLHIARRFICLDEADVTRDIDDDIACAVNRGLKQRGRAGNLDCLERLVVAVRLADTDVSDALVGHDRLHIRKVEVDETRHIDEIRDALHCLLEHFVRLAESLRHRGAAIHNLKELVVRNHNQRVNRLFEVLNACERIVHALSALKVKRLRHDADGQNTEFLRDARNDRCRTGAGAAAHAAGHEDHVRIFQRLG